LASRAAVSAHFLNTARPAWSQGCHGGRSSCGWTAAGEARSARRAQSGEISGPAAARASPSRLVSVTAVGRTAACYTGRPLRRHAEPSRGGSFPAEYACGSGSVLQERRRTDQHVLCRRVTGAMSPNTSNTRSFRYCFPASASRPVRPASFVPRDVPVERGDDPAASGRADLAGQHGLRRCSPLHGLRRRARTTGRQIPAIPAGYHARPPCWCSLFRRCTEKC
jgi:hypothetical protein